jgi:hypothetical protein
LDLGLECPSLVYFQFIARHLGEQFELWLLQAARVFNVYAAVDLRQTTNGNGDRNLVV